MYSKKTKDLNLSAFNMIIGINESKTVKKHISCERKCKFDGTKCTSNQWRNNEKCWWECKNFMYLKKLSIESNKFICKNGKYLASIIDDSMIQR